MKQTMNLWRKVEQRKVEQRKIHLIPVVLDSCILLMLKNENGFYVMFSSKQRGLE